VVDDRFVLRSLATAAGTAVMLSLASAPGFAEPVRQAPGAACTLRPNPHVSANDEWASCLAVGAAMERAPAPGESVPLRIDVTSQHRNDDVRIEADLPGNLRWEKMPDGLGSAAVAALQPQAYGRINRASGRTSIDAGRGSILANIANTSRSCGVYRGRTTCRRTTIN
jgi:hypothetical protein